MTAWRPAAAARLDRLAWLAFWLLIVVMPFRVRVDPLPHPAISLPAPLADVIVYWLDGLVLMTVIAWLVARVLDRRRINLGPRPLLIPVAALVVLGWLTLPFGVLPDLSLFGAVRLTVLVVLALYVLNEVESLASLVVPLGLMLGLQAIVAIGQFLVQGSIGLTGLGETQLDSTTPGLAVVLREDGVRILRAYGLSTHPNVLGGFFAVGILLLLGTRPLSQVGRGLQALVVALAVGGLLVTFSRGAWIGLGAGLVAGIVVLGARTILAERGHWLVIGGLALVVVAAGGWQLRDELALRSGLATAQTATERRSVDERLAQIELGWHVALERPLTGVGMSAVPVEMERLDPAFAFSYYPPHLVPLVVTAELGVGGGVAILALLGAPWFLLLRTRARWSREVAAALGALAALTVAGLFDDYPWVGGPGRTLFWFVLGLWACVWVRSAGPISSPGAETGSPAAT